jgi:hypothetical protein
LFKKGCHLLSLSDLLLSRVETISTSLTLPFLLPQMKSAE